jgi:hypothetical protein
MSLRYLRTWIANGLIVGCFGFALVWVVTEIGLAAVAKRARHLQGVSVGEGLALQGIPTDAWPGTLVLVLDTTCPYCSEGAPAYRKALAIKSPLTDQPLRSVAVCPQTVETCAAYLRAHELSVDLVVSQPLSAINVNGTPALFLLNQGGAVVGSWLGLPDQSFEMNVGRQIRDM